MLKKYANFWNIYLIILLIFLVISFMLSRLNGNMLSILIGCLFSILGILLLSDKLFKNIKRVHIIIPAIITIPTLLFFFILITVFTMVISIVILWVLNYYLIKDKFNKISNIILLTLYFVIAIYPIFADWIEFDVIGTDRLLGSVATMFVFLLTAVMFIALMFFERDKISKYMVVLCFFSILLFFISSDFPDVIKHKNNNIFTIIYILTLFIPYVLNFLDIVFGKFFTKLNDYTTKLIGISAIACSIFMLVYPLTSK